MKNWKTSLGGILTAVGLGLTANGHAGIHTVGIVLAAVGSLLTGAQAKDHDVTGV